MKKTDFVILAIVLAIVIGLFVLAPILEGWIGDFLAWTAAGITIFYFVVLRVIRDLRENRRI